MSKQDHKINRKGWGIGPWVGEPDRLEWRDGETGLPCLIVRNEMGALCGYVAVAPGHPWHGLDYSEVPVEVHGGLTYGAFCQEGSAICHTPRPGEAEDVTWFGFDCAHGGDLIPGLVAALPAGLHGRLRLGRLFQDTYRDIEYVKAEVKGLAKQVWDGRRAS